VGGGGGLSGSCINDQSLSDSTGGKSVELDWRSRTAHSTIGKPIHESDESV